MIRFFVAVSLAFALAACSHTPASEHRALVKNGAVLLDVRTPTEFSAGHIDGAVNIPVQDLAGRLAELPDKSRPVVVYCRSGRRSADATKQLLDAGYSRVVDIGAMDKW